jgi:hypothetical protein
VDRNLENGQPVALRVAMGPREDEFMGIVQNYDSSRGLVSVKVEGDSQQKASYFRGKKVTIVGRTPDVNLDLPCVVAKDSDFPVLVCQHVNRRNHVRVNTFLPLKYRHVDRSVYETDPEGFLVRIQEEMGSHEGVYEVFQEEEDEEPVHPKILALLTDMNRKLDRILMVLESQVDGQYRGPVPVNISGSGLRFQVREKIKPMSMLAVRIVLPLSPPVPIVFIGEVTRVREREKEDGSYEIAVRFVAIDEMDREEIVHYTFKRMRESVRNRNKDAPIP